MSTDQLLVRAATVKSVEGITCFDHNINEQFSTRRCYYVNRTGQPVYIKDRNGVHLTIPPHTNDSTRRGLNAFYVVYEYNTPAEHIPVSMDYPSARINRQYLPKLTTRLTIEYSVSPLDVNTQKKPLYLPNLGLILSFTEPVTDLKFPDSTKESMDKYIEYLVRSTEKNSLWASVVIVDNSSDEPKPYWMNIEDRVYRIYTIRHLDMEDGVYFRANQEPCNSHLKGKFESRYTLEECLYNGSNPDAPVLLFESSTEASYNGSKDRRTKAQTEKLDAAIKEREHTLNQQKLELEELRIKNAEIKEDIARKAEERKDYFDTMSTQRKDRSEQTRDYYDERNAQRKDSTEFLKTIGAVLGVIGGIFAGLVSMVRLLHG